MNKSFWNYIMGDNIALLVALVGVCLIIGTVSLLEGFWPMAVFMGVVIAVTFIGTYVSWKKLNKKK